MVVRVFAFVIVAQSDYSANMKIVLHCLYSVMARTEASVAVNQMRRTYSDLADVLLHRVQDAVYVPVSPLLSDISLALLTADIQDVQYVPPLFVCV